MSLCSSERLERLDTYSEALASNDVAVGSATYIARAVAGWAVCYSARMFGFTAAAPHPVD
jgi:hypothetical protein